MLIDMDAEMVGFFRRHMFFPSVRGIKRFVDALATKEQSLIAFWANFVREELPEDGYSAFVSAARSKKANAVIVRQLRSRQ